MHAPFETLPDPRLFALIPCAGSGSRAGTSIPKQYQPLAGRAMIWHTLSAFVSCPAISRILLVLAPQDNWFSAHAPAHMRDMPTVMHAQVGGNSRAESVRNGLLHLQAHGAQPHDWVLVHDAARCLVTPQQIMHLVTACRNDRVGGLLALPLPDTLKAQAAQQPQQDGSAPPDGPRVATTISRSDKWLAQTPQMFRLGVLLQALESGLQQAPEQITDESSAVERLGLQPQLVCGGAQNFKITYPEDFALAEAVLQARLGRTD
ncbi:MAG: 2-C-methyl-D-erythritol 4-phosphate cytidylyltransferase [Brachymonas sp.]